MPKKPPKWPKELQRPIVLKAEPRGLFGGLGGLGGFASGGAAEHQERSAQELRDDVTLKFKVLLEFFGHAHLPDSSERWMSLIMAICNHCELPAFQILSKDTRGPGASKKWTDQRLCELFADVQSLVEGSSAMTEHAACQYIATHLGKFGGRYAKPKKNQPGSWGNTLHRQFLRAKSMAKSNTFFRMIYFGQGPGLFGPIPEYGPELRRIAIERHAVTRNSLTSKSA